MPHLLRACLALLASGCDTLVYYPQELEPAPGWVSACDGDVDATVIVENQGENPVDVHELLPDEGCAPSDRGTVEPGETADLGAAVGPIWRIYDAETRERLGTFELEGGENTLVVP